MALVVSDKCVGESRERRARLVCCVSVHDEQQSGTAVTCFFLQGPQQQRAAGLGLGELGVQGLRPWLSAVLGPSRCRFALRAV